MKLRHEIFWFKSTGKNVTYKINIQKYKNVFKKFGTLINVQFQSVY